MAAVPRDASKRGTCYSNDVRLSVCLSVRQSFSVTLVHCVKTVKTHQISSPLARPVILVLDVEAALHVSGVIVKEFDRDFELSVSIYDTLHGRIDSRPWCAVE